MTSIPFFLSCLPKRQVNGIVPVNIVIHSLNSVLASVEDDIPEASLLAVVAAGLPALAVVQIVILHDELGTEPPEDEGEGVRRRRLDAQTAVTGDLSKHNVLMAHPPRVEIEREADGGHAEVREQRDDGNVPNLLFLVGVESQQRVGVLCQVVRAVELPERLDLVHEAVVPVEPKVEDDSVEADLYGQQVPVDIGRGHAGAVAEEDGEERAHSRGDDEREEDLGYANVGDAVAFVLVAVEEADFVAC